MVVQDEYKMKKRNEYEKMVIKNKEEEEEL